MKTAKIFLVFASMSMLVAVPVFACDESAKWANPVPNVDSKITLDAAIAQALKEWDVEVKKSDTEAECDSDTNYTVIDHGDQKYLVTIPIPNSAISAKDGRYLIVRLRQALQTPKSSLKLLRLSGDVLFADYREMLISFGIEFYVPSGLPLADRMRGDYEYLLYVGAPGNQGSNTPFFPEQNFYVNTAEYIPGRADYTQKNIYQKGEFQKKFFGNNAYYLAYRKRVIDNIAAGYWMPQKSHGYEPMRELLRAHTQQEMMTIKVKP